MEISTIGNAACGALGGKAIFDNPFLLDADQHMPDDIKSAYDLALFMGLLNPRFTNAIQNKFSFFITEVQVGDKDLDATETSEFKDLLTEEVGILNLLHQVAKSYSIYGNAFLVPYVPFTRYVVVGGDRWALDMIVKEGVGVGFKVNQETGTMKYTLKVDGKVHEVDFVDIVSASNTTVRFRTICPDRIHLIHNPISCNTQYVYDFEQSLRTAIKKNDAHSLYLINDTPREMLAALFADEDFKFSEDFIYHFKLPAIPGLVDNGLGIPPPIEHFRPLFNLQVYRKIDEAVGRDYMLPFRLFSPASGTNLQDVLQHHDLGRWRAAVSSVIKSRRVNKYAMHSLPFPVTYQEFGANGKAFAPKELIEYNQNELLNSINYPVELFSASLTWQAMPMALRLFESMNIDTYTELSRCVTWIVDTVIKFSKGEPMKAVLQRPSLADSMERRQMLIQLMQVGEISRKTALQSIGVENPVMEGSRRLDEDMELEEQRARKAEEFQRRQQAGLVSADGEGGPGMTPQDLDAQALQLAEEWLNIPTDGARSQAMQQVRAQDEQLYALAKQKMEEIRRAGESEGRAQTNQMYQQ